MRECGDVCCEGHLLVRMSSPLTAAGRQPEADAATRLAVELLEPLGPGAELLAAYSAMVTTHMLARELEQAGEWGARAVALATEVDDPRDLTYALVQDGTASLMRGDHDGGVARITEAMSLARRHGWVDRVALGLLQIGSGAGEVRRYDLAVPALRECIELTEQQEMGSRETYAAAWLARCEVELCQWDAAGARAARLLSRPVCNGISRMTALTGLGLLRAWRGDPGVWPALDEALLLARETGHLQRLWPVAAARAEAAWLEGRLPEELSLVEEVDTVALALRYPWASGELGYWRWRAGEPIELPVDRRPRSRCRSPDARRRRRLPGRRWAAATRQRSRAPTWMTRTSSAPH